MSAQGQGRTAAPAHPRAQQEPKVHKSNLMCPLHPKENLKAIQTLVDPAGCFLASRKPSLPGFSSNIQTEGVFVTDINIHPNL